MLVLTAALALNSAYAKKFQLTAASSVPAARGVVETGRDKNGNTEVKMKVEHLARPESLTPPKTAYVVWFQEKGGETANQGQLTVNKKLEGTFRTVTPLKNFDLFVTAEQEPGTKTPSGSEVLRTSVQP